MVEFSFDFTVRNQADDVIDALIEKVLKAYPEKRLEEIKARTASAWKDKNYGQGAYGDRIPYVVLSLPPAEMVNVPADATQDQKDIINQLMFMLHNSMSDCDYFPAFTSGLEQVAVPSMFGCVKECSSASERVKPIIHSPGDVYSLAPAQVREGFVCYEILRKMAYYAQRTGGRIPVYMTDVQGPFSCAAQMWGIQDFLCDLNEYPNEAHHLLALCTDAIIQFFQEMYAVTGGNLVPIHCMPVIWVPKDCGVAVSDDFFAIVGANTIREFSCPYLEKIGETFGGITAHTCGNMNHLVKVMNEMKTLRALNFSASETDLRQYASGHDPKTLLFVHKSDLSIGGLPLLNAEEHIRFCKEIHKEYHVNIIANGVYTPDPLSKELCQKWKNAASLQG